AAEALQCPGRHRVDLLLVADVHLHRQRLRAQRLDLRGDGVDRSRQLLALRRALRRDHHGAAGPRQPQRDRPADAAARAPAHRHATLQLRHCRLRRLKKNPGRRPGLWESSAAHAAAETPISTRPMLIDAFLPSTSTSCLNSSTQWLSSFWRSLGASAASLPPGNSSSTPGCALVVLALISCSALASIVAAFLSSPAGDIRQNS